MSAVADTGEASGSGMKDRKRSAHWSDDDTTVLLNHLLAHRDTGRTADNGFKPEIWREAAALLDRASVLETDHHASSSIDPVAAAAAAVAANMGGPKTPEACKSRWQRLQRDFRAVREMEEVKGFEFDRSTWRLKASAEDWAMAEKNITDAAKFQKIYLPHYDSLAILCSNETARSRVRTKPRVSFAASADSEGQAMIPGGGGSSHGHHRSPVSRGGGSGRGMDGEQDVSGTDPRQQPGPDLTLSLNGARSRRHIDQAHLQHLNGTHGTGLPPGAVWHDHASSSSLTDYNGFTVNQSYLPGSDKAYSAFGSEQAIHAAPAHRQGHHHATEGSQKNDGDRPSPPKRPRGISRQLSNPSQPQAQQQSSRQQHEQVAELTLHTPLHGTQSLEPTPLHSPVITTTRNTLLHPGLIGSPELHTGMMDQSIMQSPDGSFFIANTVRSGQEYGQPHHPPQGAVPGGFALEQPSPHQHQQSLSEQQQQDYAATASISDSAAPMGPSSSRRSARRDRASKTQSQMSAHHAPPSGQQNQAGQNLQSVGFAPVPGAPPQHSPQHSSAAANQVTPGHSSTTSISSSLPAMPPDMSVGAGPGLSSQAAMAAAGDMAPTLPPPPTTRTRHGRKQSSANAMTVTLQQVQQTAPPAPASQSRTETGHLPAPIPPTAPPPGTMVIVAPHSAGMPGQQPLVFPVPPSSSSSSSSQPVLKSPSLRVSVDGTPLHEASPSYFPPFGGFGLSPIPQHGLGGASPMSVLPGASPVVLRPDHLRRIDAVMRLQAQETEMHDEDLVEVMAEFETNVAAADTYLAIQKEGLRKMWLLKLVARRKGMA